MLEVAKNLWVRVTWTHHPKMVTSRIARLTWQPLGPRLKVKLLAGYIRQTPSTQRGWMFGNFWRSPDRCAKIWICGTPKSSILIGFSIIKHPFWDTPIFGNFDGPYFWSAMGSTNEALIPCFSDRLGPVALVATEKISQFVGFIVVFSSFVLGFLSLLKHGCFQ